MASWLPSAGRVAPLRRTRVLLVSRDRRFLGLATLLLGRRGFDVERVTSPSRVVDAVERDAVDVVVVDGSGSLADALAGAHTIRARYPETGVVLAADDAPTEHLSGVEVVAKWSSAEALAAAVMRNRSRPVDDGWGDESGC